MTQHGPENALAAAWNARWLTLLPVENARTLLRGLAGLWTELLGGPVAVSFLSADGRQLLAGWSEAPHLPPHVCSWNLPGWHGPTARDRLPRAWDRGPSDFATAAFSGSPDSPPEFAPGGILFDAAHRDRLEAVPAGALEFSARAIQQLWTLENPRHWQNQALFERTGRSEGPISGDARPVFLDESRLEALAEFAAGAGHEINNPLATISGRVQMLAPSEDDPERRQSLLTIGAQALRIRDMIGDLMLFARPPAPVPQPLNLSEVVRVVIDRLGDLVRQANVSIAANLPESVPIWADRTQLSVAVSCLLQNAVESCSGGGRIQVDVQLSPSPAEGGVPLAHLQIADTGRGFSDKERMHLFDPFFSGRQAGRGLGFGLCKCWRIVSNHRGWIEVSSPNESGAVFDVFWPSAERRTSEDPEHGSSHASA